MLSFVNSNAYRANIVFYFIFYLKKLIFINFFGLNYWEMPLFR